MATFEQRRRRMVRDQIEARGVRDPAVLEAMAEVPREAFVPEAMREHAYDDGPLPIGSEQTISQPYIVAAMAAALRLEPTDRVLEVGAGSGYAAAVLGRIASAVYAVERIGDLAEGARQRMDDLGYDNVHVRHGDGSVGWPEAAPFDAIVVAAAGPRVPDSLRRQLAVGGRMVIPVGPTRFEQHLLRLTRVDEERFEEEELDPVRFVPLLGEEAWPAASPAAPSGPEGVPGTRPVEE